MAKRISGLSPGLEHVHPSRTQEAIEAERSALGAVLWGTAPLEELDDLAPSDFGSPAHSILLTALRALKEDGGAIEITSLVARLAMVGDLEAAGGRAYVEEISSRGGSPDLPYFARRIREWAAERRALAAAREFISEAHKPCSRSPIERLVVDATPGSIDPPDRKTGGRESATDDAATFLRGRLSDGPVLAETVRDDAERAGISEATMRRAADSLDVQSTKEKGRPHGSWWWSLPAGQGTRDGRALSVLPELVAEEGPVKAVS